MTSNVKHSVNIEIPIKEIKTLFRLMPIYEFYSKTSCEWVKMKDNANYYYKDNREMRQLRALYKRLEKAIMEE